MCLPTQNPWQQEAARRRDSLSRSSGRVSTTQSNRDRKVAGYPSVPMSQAPLSLLSAIQARYPAHYALWSSELAFSNLLLADWLTAPRNVEITVRSGNVTYRHVATRRPPEMLKSSWIPALQDAAHQVLLSLRRVWQTRFYTTTQLLSDRELSDLLVETEMEVEVDAEPSA